MTRVEIWGADAGDFYLGNLVWSALNALRPAMAEPPAHVDLTRLQFVRPYTLAALAALGCLAGRNARIALPVTQDSRDYLVRSGLLDFFAGTEVADISASARIVPVRQLDRVSSTFADEIVAAWERAFGGMPAGLRPRLADHLDEIVRNALAHAESPIGCTVAATVYPERKQVELCVLDLGQTIRGHLVKHPAYAHIATDRDAIVEATAEGVTGTLPGALNRLGEPNSGVGLYELRAYCEAGGGDLAIASGEAIVVFGAGQRPIVKPFAGGFPGCLVNVRFLVW